MSGLFQQLPFYDYLMLWTGYNLSEVSQGSYVRTLVFSVGMLIGSENISSRENYEVTVSSGSPFWDHNV